MSSNLPSNIHVFVTFKEDAVFAGETIDATITFKNVDIPRQPSTATRQDLVARHPSKAKDALSRPSLSRTASISSHQPPQISSKPIRGHRPNLSLQIDKSSIRTQAQSLLNGSAPEPESAGHSARPSSQGRSVSIVSMGNEAGDDKNWGTQLTRIPSRPGKHSRSSSLQVTPVLRPSGRASPMDDMRSYRRGSIASAPRYQSAESYFAPQFRNTGLGIISNGISSPSEQQSPITSKRLDSFDFPTSSRPQSPTQRPAAPQRTRSTPTTAPKRPLPFRPLSPRISEDKHSTSSSLAAINASAPGIASEDATPRSSTDVYSMSNGSDETLDSGFIPAASRRLIQRPEFIRQSSSLNPNARIRQPENLMMGYAHVTGSFMLDGSLANQAPFEEVKRKAVVGGQAGGGVVGVEQRKQTSGFFGAFGWSAIGESIGGLLHSGEMSSIREMKGIANSEEIPLLSTPKSILFVDLTLSPGESRSYSYAFTLPRGLPPSHRGRAMKVSYNLVIGTQRPQTSTSKKQPIRHAEVPFRVFGNVNRKGENLSHDLMTPYTILKDQARTSALERDSNGVLKALAPAVKAATVPLDTEDSEAVFQSYVNSLLTRPRRSSSVGLLSPTDYEHMTPITPTASNPQPAPAFSFNNIAQPSPRALIDLAIQRSTQPLPLAPSSASNSPNPQTTSPTHFTIARSGSPIATLILSRPFLRLGDVLNFALDFSAATIPCHAITVTLESSENIASLLALRSEASVERATRRIWDRCTGDRIGWAQHWSGSVKVPWSATPGFDTTGVGCTWVLRVEITVERIDETEQDTVQDADNDDGDEKQGEVSDIEPGNGNAVHHERWKRSEKLLKRVLVVRRRKRAMSRKHDGESGSVVEDQDDEASKVEDDTLFRGISAVQVESFEISVPLRIFGAAGAGVTTSPEEKAVGYPV